MQCSRFAVDPIGGTVAVRLAFRFNGAGETTTLRLDPVVTIEVLGQFDEFSYQCEADGVGLTIEEGESVLTDTLAAVHANSAVDGAIVFDGWQPSDGDAMFTLDRSGRGEDQYGRPVVERQLHLELVLAH